VTRGQRLSRGSVNIRFALKAINVLRCRNMVLDNVSAVQSHRLLRKFVEAQEQFITFRFRTRDFRPGRTSPMWTLLLIAALVLISFRMFVWHHEDRDRMPFEATLVDEDRTRLHQLIDKTIDRAPNPHTDMR